MGAPAPQRGDKKFRHNLQGKFVSAPPPHHTKCNPPGIARVNFRTFLLGGGDLQDLVDLDRLLRAMTKNDLQLF